MSYLLTLLPLVVAAIEAISYPGFLARHTGISAYYIYLLIPLIFLLLKPRFPKFITLLLAFASYAAAVLLFILEFAEKFKYPNFVFTYTHIHLIGLMVCTFILWFVYMQITLANNMTSLAKSSLIGALVCVFSLQAGRTVAIASVGAYSVVKAPLASYDQKMSQVYPGFYEAMQLVKAIVPADASLIIPPQGNPWEMEGNGAIMTYFLYPRRIVPSYLDKPLPKGDYALIAKGSWVKRGDVDYGWPKLNIKADSLWSFDLSAGTFVEIKDNYDPNRDNWDWGLIKLKYE